MALSVSTKACARIWHLTAGLLVAAIVSCWIYRHGGIESSLLDLRQLVRFLVVGMSAAAASSGPLWLLFPTFLMIAWAGTLLMSFDKPGEKVRWAVGAVFLVLQLGYLGFRLMATLCWDTRAEAIVSSLFFLSEAFIHFRIALGNLFLVRLTDRSADADALERRVVDGRFRPAVDVFVPTYSEPVEILRRTIIGCQAIDYPNKTVYLLDDQRRPEMRRLAEELGCIYLERPDNRHAKAGNLNHALTRSSGDLIVCFDADFIPTRDFLRRTAGFFEDPQVAMVQTPQNFFNEDAVMRNLGLEKVLEDEQRFFFRALQAGRDSFNAIVCHGSCFVVRRSALEGIGGVPTETITEDWATSIKLQAAGHKLYYLNEPLSAGVSADRCGEFVQQRARWAQGTLQALFASTNPVRIGGLNIKQRMMHFAGVLYYVGSLSSMFNLIAPLFYLVFGIKILQMTLPEMMFYRLPLIAGYYMLFSWLTCRTRSALWTEFYDAFLAPTMALTVIRSFLKPFGVGFRVTDKSVKRQGLSMNRQVAWPFVLLFALHVLGLFLAVMTQKPYEDGNAFYIAAYFAVGNLVTLWICILVTIDVGRKNSAVRFEHHMPAVLAGRNAQQVEGETIYLSESDMVFRPAMHIEFDELPDVASVLLPNIGGGTFTVRLKEISSSGEVELEFVDLSLQQRRVLVEFLFCEPRRWNRPPRSEIRAIWEYLRAGLRLYPLTH